jgi:reactive chlorine resistance protein C
MATARMVEDERQMSVHTLETIGAAVIRYGLVAILLWVGPLKFTVYEAEGIQPFVTHSPLLSWAYDVMSVGAFSAVLGVIEIALGVLIALRPCAASLSALGSIGAIIMFLITLTFTLSTPGVWQPGYGFSFPSPMPGQFLAKDLLFLGGALWTAGESLRAASQSNRVSLN